MKEYEIFKCFSVGGILIASLLILVGSCQKKESCYDCTVYYNDDQAKAGQIFTADQNICGKDHLDFASKYGDMADSLNYECILISN